MHSPNLLGISEPTLPAIPQVTKMIKNKRLSPIVFIAFCAGVPALTQTQPKPAAQTQTQPRVHTPAAKAPAPRQPYTVEFKTTHVYTQPNGAVITTESKEVDARDNNGHRMISTTNPPQATRPAITSVHVNDPATGDDIHWDSTTKVAHDIKRPVGAARQGCWATPDGRFRANYGHGNAATGPDGRDIAMAAVKQAPGEDAPVNPVNSNRVQEDLGANTIMGVEVRGLRATTTTPAGAAGNDQPLVHTDEYWMAPSLGMALRSITVDPRMGKTQREAVSVDLTNPDPSLFQPPAGYQLETEAMQPVDCPK